MFAHNFAYTIKILFRNKILVFFSFAFPIILALFFHLAFSNIEKSEKQDIIPIAIVQKEEFSKDTILKESFKELSKGKNALFKVNYTTVERAKSLLQEGKIIGYLDVSNGQNKIKVKNQGIDETVFTFVVEEILQNKKVIQDLVETEVIENESQGKKLDYAQIYIEAKEKLAEKEYTKDITRAHLSYTMVEYYTLIAMACLYGATFGMFAINNVLANMSTKGMRVSSAPIPKMKLVTSSALASFIVQMVGVLLLFLFTVFALKADYGNRLGLILLLAALGSFAGLSLGMMLATVIRTKEENKIGLIISITMLGCFLSGMMGITMKYIIDKNVPLVNMLNPANMITDGFYALYYYDTLHRYWFNVISLSIFSLLMLLISYLALRRQKYDSI